MNRLSILLSLCLTGVFFLSGYDSVQAFTKFQPAQVVSNPAEIRGTISYDNGTPIPNQIIVIHNTSNGQQDYYLTDLNGDYNIEVEPGSYLVEVDRVDLHYPDPNSIYSYGQVKNVDISSGSIRNVNFVLERDPVDMQILGGEFVKDVFVPFSISFTNGVNGYQVFDISIEFKQAFGFFPPDPPDIQNLSLPQGCSLFVSPPVQVVCEDFPLSQGQTVTIAGELRANITFPPVQIDGVIAYDTTDEENFAWRISTLDVVEDLDPVDLSSTIVDESDPIETGQTNTYQIEVVNQALFEIPYIDICLFDTGEQYGTPEIRKQSPGFTGDLVAQASSFENTGQPCGTVNNRNRSIWRAIFSNAYIQEAGVYSFGMLVNNEVPIQTVAPGGPYAHGAIQVEASLFPAADFGFSLYLANDDHIEEYIRTVDVGEDDIKSVVNPAVIHQSFSILPGVNYDLAATAEDVSFAGEVSGGDIASASEDCSTIEYVYTCDLGDLAPNESKTISLEVVATEPGTIEVSGKTLALNDELDDSDNSVLETTTVLPPPPPIDVCEGADLCYTFNEGESDIVNDSSTQGPVQLQVNDSNAIMWINGGLQITDPTIIKQVVPGAPLDSGFDMTKNEITLEAWVRTSGLNQTGPARIFTFSKNTGQRNFTFGQGTGAGYGEGGIYSFRLNTSDPFTSRNGLPSVDTDNTAVQQALQHVVYTKDASGRVVIYINDEIIFEDEVYSGDFSTWKAFEIALGNEFTMDRPWKGTYCKLAIYDNALSSSDVHDRYNAGSEGNGNSCGVDLGDSEKETTKSSLINPMGLSSQKPDGLAIVTPYRR